MKSFYRHHGNQDLRNRRLFLANGTPLLRTRALLLVSVGLIALGFPASALAKKFTLQGHFPNHTPTANKKWPISVDVTAGKTKLSGSVKYEFEFQGQVVSTQPGKKFKNGLYKDALLFPSDAVGQPLTLVVLVKTSYGTESISWAVTTQK